MTRAASFPLISFFFPLTLHLVLLFIFVFHSRAFVLACLYTGHAFPRNGSAYELRARWEYGWNEISDGSWKTEEPARTGNRAYILNLYEFYKTCLPPVTRYRQGVTMLFFSSFSQ